jgi:hypothetical protein
VCSYSSSVCDIIARNCYMQPRIQFLTMYMLCCISGKDTSEHGVRYSGGSHLHLTVQVQICTSMNYGCDNFVYLWLLNNASWLMCCYMGIIQMLFELKGVLQCCLRLQCVLKYCLGLLVSLQLLGHLISPSCLLM